MHTGDVLLVLLGKLEQEGAAPGVRGAVGPFSPAVSTMLPSVCTTISVAFSVFRLSPI